MKEEIKTWNSISDELVINNIDEQINNIITHVVVKRTKLGITQRDLAILTKIKQPAIARMESFRAVPQLDTLLKIIEPLGLELKIIETK